MYVPGPKETPLNEDGYKGFSLSSPYLFHEEILKEPSNKLFQ